jgi:hypothetical protein
MQKDVLEAPQLLPHPVTHEFGVTFEIRARGRRARVSGAVARLRLLERIRLSPEDYSEPEMRRLKQAPMADGVRVFVFSFHSPSVLPGGTRYVRSDADLERFLEKCRRYFDFFLRELGGTAMTPLGVKDHLMRDSRHTGGG